LLKEKKLLGCQKRKVKFSGPAEKGHRPETGTPSARKDKEREKENARKINEKSGHDVPPIFEMKGGVTRKKANGRLSTKTGRNSAEGDFGQNPQQGSPLSTLHNPHGGRRLSQSIKAPLPSVRATKTAIKKRKNSEKTNHYRPAAKGKPPADG